MKKASSDLVLLDVSVLLPLAWPHHPFNRRSVRFLDDWKGRWATCAITQLGFIRLSANPAAVRVAVSASEARRLLEAMTRDPMHLYLGSLGPPASNEYGGLFDKILGSRMTTDAYLVALAEQEGAVFATFDTRLASLSNRVMVLDPAPAS